MNDPANDYARDWKMIAQSPPAREPARCDDARTMEIWRECGLPEWFLGNGGSNHHLVEFRGRVLEEAARICERRAARNKAVGRVDAAGSADACAHAIRQAKGA